MVGARFLIRDAPGGRAYSITCSQCGDRAQLAPTTSSGTLPPEMITKKFQQRGWWVGKKPSKDTCPACQRGNDNQETDVKIAKVDKNLRAEIVNLVPATEEPTVPTLTREHRRIVLAKLNEVYQDETTGYRPGWSDRKVAEDLGIDVQSVEELRRDNFGDLPSSAIDQHFLDDARKLLDELQDVRAQAEAVKQQAYDMLQEAIKNLGKVQGLEQRMDDLLAQEQLLAEQIAKVAA